jgi:hypothetical protein
MRSDMPPAGTPVDQKIYNEACRKIGELEAQVAELRDLLRYELELDTVSPYHWKIALERIERLQKQNEYYRGLLTYVVDS